MLDIALKEPLQHGLNVVKVTARDYSFATTALVTIEKMDNDIFCCKNISYASTLGGIPNIETINKAIEEYLSKQKIS